MKKYLLFLLVLIQIIFFSCATKVSFDVEHPPIIDLRNVNSITVIPFEWNVSSRYLHIAGDVTAALVTGVRRGSISYVDPSMMRYISSLDYWRHADVYITGRISNVSVSDSFHSREEKGRRDTQRTVTTTTRIVTVDIEYTYVHARSNKVLGHFRKSASETSTIERARSHQSSHSRRHNTGYWANDQWTDSMASSAITQFSNNMNREIDIWKSTENRNVKGHSSGLSEAKRMIRHKYYGRAFEIYSDIYEQNGDIQAGYNLSLLLQFDDKYQDALDLLKLIHKNTMESGKRVPSYITKEIAKISGFIDGFEILKEYRKPN